MSYSFSPAELKHMNLTIYISSEDWLFGKTQYEHELIKWTVKYSSYLRVHKPPLNNCDPIFFICRAVTNVIDGVRGPFKHLGKPMASLPEEEIELIRKQLKALKDDPTGLLKEVLVKGKCVEVKQPVHSVLLCDIPALDFYCEIPIKSEQSTAIEDLLTKLQSSEKLNDDTKKLIQAMLSTLKYRVQIQPFTQTQNLYDVNGIRIAYRTISPLTEKSTAIGAIVATFNDGDQFTQEIGPDISLEEINNTINELRAAVPLHKAEEYISNTFDMRMGKFPTESKTLVSSSHCQIDFYRY